MSEQGKRYMRIRVVAFAKCLIGFIVIVAVSLLLFHSCFSAACAAVIAHRNVVFCFCQQ